MSNNDPRRGAWSATNWAVTTADEARNVEGPKMVVPDSQANSIRYAQKRPHGLCKHFRLEDGQEIVRDTNFIRGLILGEFSDSAYLSEWLSKSDGYGICALIGSETLIHAVHPGTCTLKQAKAWNKSDGVFSWQRGEGHIVVCPCWELAPTQAGKGCRRR